MPSNEYFVPEAGEALSRILSLMSLALDKILRLAKGYAPTDRIMNAMSIVSPTAKANTIEGGISVDLTAAPEGAALEFGSGLYATRGPRGKYPIDPKKPGGKLVFDWPNEDLTVGHRHTKDGKVILSHVEHPGVVAKPYLVPAFESVTTDELIEDVGKEMDALFGAGQHEELHVEIRI